MSQIRYEVLLLVCFKDQSAFKKSKLVMGKMKFSSESTPASSEVFCNQFWIVVLESVFGIDSGIQSGIGPAICSGIRIDLENGIRPGIEIDSGIGIGSEIRFSFRYGISIRIGVWVQLCYLLIATNNQNLLVNDLL